MPPKSRARPPDGLSNDDTLLDETDDATDPEATAHEDPDPETLAHTDDADAEALAGHLDAGPLEGHEDGRLLE